MVLERLLSSTVPRSVETLFCLRANVEKSDPRSFTLELSLTVKRCSVCVCVGGAYSQQDMLDSKMLTVLINKDKRAPYNTNACHEINRTLLAFVVFIVSE